MRVPKLRGKTAVVTGGNSGIGLAIAKRFAEEGAYVFITGRRQAQLDAALNAIAPQAGGRVEAVQGDVTQADDLERLFAIVKEKSGALDILVTSSGTSEYATLESTTEEHFDKLFDLNVRGMVFTVQRAIKLMASGGSIVLVGSIAGSKGTAGYGSYSATKAAVRSYARTWTSELSSRAIRVNTLSPGPVDTPIFDGVSNDIKQWLTQQIPLSRMGQPDEVANAALFLASADSSFVAGAELCIDGGMTQV
jgi:NAD(P)-dependent dehydrogenase (short-subunit alcohol dehydrogenase family)